MGLGGADYGRFKTNAQARDMVTGFHHGFRPTRVGQWPWSCPSSNPRGWLRHAHASLLGNFSPHPNPSTDPKVIFTLLLCSIGTSVVKRSGCHFSPSVYSTGWWREPPSAPPPFQCFQSQGPPGLPMTVTMVFRMPYLVGAVAPRATNPFVMVGPIRPITGCPDIADAGTSSNRSHYDQRRRRRQGCDHHWWRSRRDHHNGRWH